MSLLPVYFLNIHNDQASEQRPINRAVLASSRIDPALFCRQGIDALSVLAIKAHALMKTWI
jgi:hypothetical protein